MLILICTISRACSAIGVSTLRPMGHSEYAGNFQKGISKGNIIALCAILIITVAIASYLFSLDGFIISVATILGYVFATAYAFKNLDGFSGDVTGFGHTIAELCGVIVLTLM